MSETLDRLLRLQIGYWRHRSSDGARRRAERIGGPDGKRTYVER
jgi:hypothetical protein